MILRYIFRTVMLWLFGRLVGKLWPGRRWPF